MTTDAQKKAQRKYDIENKERFRFIHMKLNKETDTDILSKLDAVDSMQGYIKDLIRKDIKSGN